MDRIPMRIGAIFGQLTIIKELPDKQVPTRVYRRCLVKCACGNTKAINYKTLTSSRPTISCGCAVGPKPTHNSSKTRLYKIWIGMKSRCYRPNCNTYKHYGAKGIRVSNDWTKSFINFEIWALANGYADNLSIDRIDNTGDYIANNCRFTTNSVQGHNQGLRTNNTSGIKGIYYVRKHKIWTACTRVNGKKLYLRPFKTKEEATEALLNFLKENNLTEHIRGQAYDQNI